MVARGGVPLPTRPLSPRLPRRALRRLGDADVGREEVVVVVRIMRTRGVMNFILPIGCMVMLRLRRIGD